MDTLRDKRLLEELWASGDAPWARAARDDAAMSAPTHWAGRRVLVTGATGIVGSWLCEALLARGASVVALVLDDDPQSRFYADAIAGACSIVRGNLARDRGLRARDQLLRVRGRVPSRRADDRRDGAARSARVLRIEHPRHVQPARGGAPRCSRSSRRSSSRRPTKRTAIAPVLPYTEDMPLNGKHPYDVSKSCADLLAAAYHHTYGLPVTIARCGNVYGGGDLNWSRIVPGTIRSLLRGERPVLRSDGAPVRDYIYVEDAVDAYIALAEAAERRGRRRRGVQLRHAVAVRPRWTWSRRSLA